MSLEAKDIVLKAGAQTVNQSFAPGQITCLAGLDGHGQEDFLEVLAGWERPVTGSVIMHGEGGSQAVRDGRQASRLNIAYLPRDRRENGIFPSLSILDNFAISSIGRDSRLGITSNASRQRRFDHYKKMFSIIAQEPKKPITALSGGNQQKVLIARLLATDPKVLLLNDPTRGVDVATRVLLYDIFAKLVSEGMTLIIVSTEIEEAIKLADQVLVFRDHEITARLSGAEKTNERVLAGMFGEAA